jgi:predicted Rossmann-fold nucleotide-binding protein
MIDWVRDELLADGMISREDLDLLHTTDDLDEAVRAIVDCYEERTEVPTEKKADAAR